MRSHLELVAAASAAGFAVVANLAYVASAAAAAAAAVAAGDQTQKKQVTFPGDHPSTHLLNIPLSSTCKAGRCTTTTQFAHRAGLAKVARLRIHLHATRDAIPRTPAASLDTPPGYQTPATPSICIAHALSISSQTPMPYLACHQAIQRSVCRGRLPQPLSFQICT